MKIQKNHMGIMWFLLVTDINKRVVKDLLSKKTAQ